MLGQALAITGINIKSIPQRWATSLVIIIGLAGVVAVFTALLAMAGGFASTLKATGRSDAVIIMRGGSDTELNSGLDREQTDIIKQAPGIAAGADGKAAASAEMVVIAELVRKDDKANGANITVRGVEPAFAHDPETLQPDDIKRRRRNMRKHRLPHLVADRGGVVVAYAYAVLFRKRPAYRYAVKHSIYVHPDHLHAGIGRALLPALIDACAAAGFRQMIGYIDAANAPLDRPAHRLRLSAGRLPSVGRLQIRPMGRHDHGATLTRQRRHHRT